MDKTVFPAAALLKIDRCVKNQVALREMRRRSVTEAEVIRVIEREVGREERQWIKRGCHMNNTAKMDRKISIDSNTGGKYKVI